MFNLKRASFVAAVVATLQVIGFAQQRPGTSQGEVNPPTVQDQDLVLGAWQLDLAHSTFSPGPPPRSEIRSYQEEHEGIKAEIVTVNADGLKTHMEYLASFNDVVAVVTGSTQTDAIRLRKLDPYTAESELSYGGKLVGRARRVVSKDAQTLTITLDRTAPGAVHNVEVFRRVN